MSSCNKRSVEEEGGVADSSQEPKKAKESTVEIINEDDPEIGAGDVKWQVTKKEVKERMAHLRASSDFSDCLLLVGNGDVKETIRAHAMVLCMSSPKFEEIIILNKNNESITIADIEPNVFHLMLDYMYLDKVDLKNTEDACSVFKAAMLYTMPHLCEVAARYIAKDLTYDNIWPVMQLVAETEEPVLKEECAKFIRKNPVRILQHDCFKTLKQSVVYHLVDLDCLDIPELEVIRAVDRWAEHQCTELENEVSRVNKRQIIGPEILGKLRVLAVSQDDFVKHLAYTPERNSLLTLEESYAALMNLTSLGSYPMPLSFSKDNRPRKLTKLRCIRKVQQSVVGMGGGGMFNTAPTLFGSQFSNNFDRVMALASPTPQAGFGGKNFCSEIRVDHPVVMFGIQVPTMWFAGQGSKMAVKEYEESFVVTVQEGIGGAPVSHTVFNTRVPYGNTVDITLKDPVTLHRNQQYKIQVYTSNTYFLCKKLSLFEDCPPVRFSFRDTAKVTNYPAAPYSAGTGGMKQDVDYGFIMQIIYSLK